MLFFLVISVDLKTKFSARGARRRKRWGKRERESGSTRVAPRRRHLTLTRATCTTSGLWLFERLRPVLYRLAPAQDARAHDATRRRADNLHRGLQMSDPKALAGLFATAGGVRSLLRSIDPPAASSQHGATATSRDRLVASGVAATRASSSSRARIATLTLEPPTQSGE